MNKIYDLVIKGGTVWTTSGPSETDVAVKNGIISEIGVQDLTHAGLFIDSRSFRSFEVFTTLTLLYLGLSLIFKYILARANLILFPYLLKS